MSVEDRTNSAVFKREEQLRRWLNSDTNAESALPNLASRKIQFSTGCVFLAACAASDKDEVLRLLKEKADIDTANVDGLTALHQACIDDNLEMVEFLIEQGADVNRGDNEGWTPLHATASCGFVSIAKYLIENGADVAAVNNDGELPSDIAEPSDMEDLLQEMIDQKGIDREEARRQEERIMLEDVSAWLNGSSDVDPMKAHPKTGATGLHVAAAKGYIKVLSLLLQGEPDVDQQDLDGWTALHAAAHWGQTEALQLLSTHFCNFDIKNFAGQTAMDVADNQILETLKDLKSKQAALQKDRPAIINRGITSPNRRSSITRLSEKDKTSLVTKDVTTERQILDRTIVEEPKPLKENAEKDKEDDSLQNEDSPVEKLNRANRDDSSRMSGPTIDVELRKPVSPTEVTKPRAENEPEDGQKWKKPFPVPAPRPEITRLQPSVNNNSQQVDQKKTPRIQTNPPSNVILRRTHSFETDQTFYQKYLELHARIANSCPSLHPSPVRLPARSASLREKYATRRGLREEGKTETTETAPARPVSLPTAAPTAPARTNANDSLTAQLTVRSPSKGSGVGGSPVSPTTPSTPSTPTTPGGSKLSPGNIFKNFFKSFVPPVRDEESETQRKAHAKRVRETRRSTQGVTLEDVKSAEQLVKKRNHQTTPIDQNHSSSTVTATITPLGTGTAAPPPVAPSPADAAGQERRPSWRLKVDSNCKFLLEDARNKPSATQVPPARGRVVSPATSPADSTATSPSVSEPTSPGSEASVTLPRPRLDDQDPSASTLSTQAVIQRRRKPKRRSTGVVHVDMDEIDPDRQDSKAEDAEDRVPNTTRSEDKSRLGSVSSLASSKPEENGEVDYKKLYEAEYAANERLRETLKKTEDELDQVRNVKGSTSTSEAEKRERRAMERKLSEMEEELKQLQKLKAENERLKAENRALTRVVSKLTNSAHK